MKADYTIIVAYDEENGIGKNGDLPWGRSLKADLSRFRDITTGNTIVMGRTTYNSIGHALPNRDTLVLSRETHYTLPDATVIHTPSELASLSLQGSVFIVGGAMVYETFMPHVSRILATEIAGTFDADTFFPKIVSGEWHEVHREHVPRSDINAYDFDFVEYRRNAA